MPGIVHRPLGAIERYIWSGEQAAPMNGAIVAHVSGRIDAEAVGGALQAVQHRHPLLRVMLLPGGPRMLLTSHGVGAIPLRWIESTGRDDQWLQVVRSALRQRFEPGRGPLLRCFVVADADDFHLILSGSHLIGDGLSTLRLLAEILQQLGSPQPLQPLPALPPLEFLIPSGVVERLARRPPPQGFAADAITAPATQADGAATTSDDGTQLTHWTLPIAARNRLLDGCHQQRVSVQSAICALLLQALGSLDGDMQRIRRLQMPVNIRDRLRPEAAGHYGSFITLAGIELAFDAAGGLWSTARAAQQQLVALLDDAALFGPLLAIKSASDKLDDAQFLAAFGGREHAPWDLSVNNMGRLPVDECYGMLRVRAVWGPILNADSFETVFGINSFGDTMSFVVSNGVAARGAALREAFLGALDALR